MFNPNSSKCQTSNWMPDTYRKSSSAFILVAGRRAKHCRKRNESVWVKGKSPVKSPELKPHPFLNRTAEMFQSSTAVKMQNRYNQCVSLLKAQASWFCCLCGVSYLRRSCFLTGSQSPTHIHTHIDTSLLLWRTAAHTHREEGERKGGVKRVNLLVLNLCLPLLWEGCAGLLGGEIDWAQEGTYIL